MIKGVYREALDMIKNTRVRIPKRVLAYCATIKQLKDGLLINLNAALKFEYIDTCRLFNPTVALKFEYMYNSWLNVLLTVRYQNLQEIDLGNTLIEENVRQLSEIITTCKQLRVLKLTLSDNSESFFLALSYNQSLRELSIQTTGKMATLLFQTLPSTSVTTLHLSMQSCSERLGNEVSLAFKEYIHGSKVLTVLRVESLTEEAFKGITFTKDSSSFERT